VEVGVQVVERSVLAALRNRRFFSLGEAQAAIREAVYALNARPFKRLSGSRQSRFETLEKPALNPLPATRYEYGTWTKARVQNDYHLEVAGNHYSVPSELFGQVVDGRVTARTLEVFFKGRRVASHTLRQGTGQIVTNPLHQPESHRRYAEWSTEKAAVWAVGIGPSMVSFIESVVASKGHPEQARRACLGIVRLGRSYDRERLESAAARALAIRSVSYRSLETILRYDLDKVAVQRLELAGVGNHSNIRGPEYYRSAEVRPC
jgi:hypothetical protein